MIFFYNATTEKKATAIAILLCIFFITKQVNAQFAYPYSAGLGVGGTMMHADFKTADIGYNVNGTFDRNITPFLTTGITLQAGKASGNSVFGGYKNNFIAGDLNIKLRAGQFYAAKKNYGLYSIKNQSLLGYLSYLYVGIGAGVIRNNIDAKIKEGNDIPYFDDEFGSYDKTKMVIPAYFGIDLPFKQSMTGPTWAININYQLNMSSYDRLDGFIPRGSNHNDFYSCLTIGVKKALFGKKQSIH